MEVRSSSTPDGVSFDFGELGTLRVRLAAEAQEEVHFESLVDVESRIVSSQPDLLNEELGFEAPIWSAWITALAGQPGTSEVMMGTAGPWLLSTGSAGSPPHYVPLLHATEWTRRLPAHDPSWLWEDGIRRIRLGPVKGIACGGPNLLFLRDEGGWREAQTRVPVRASFCDALELDGELWLLTEAGDLWRCSNGLTRRVVTGNERDICSEDERFDLCRFGSGLAAANGAAGVHFWDRERLQFLAPPGLDDAVRWLASPSPQELWLATESRLFVGDGKHWFEPTLPAAGSILMTGLCADPTGGVWATGSDDQSRPLLLRATVAQGVRRVALRAPEEQPPFALSTPSPHRGGVVAAAGEQFLTHRPSGRGTSLSFRMGGDMRGLAALARLSRMIDAFVQERHGWQER